jgi:IS30 family transposase
VAYRSIDSGTILKQTVINHLKQEWSPDQIVYRLGISSISSIYRFTDKHSELKQYLRRHGGHYRKYGTSRIPSRYQANKSSIHERPSINYIGYREGDTILGKERTLRIVTYVDRASGYLVAAKVPGGADVIHQHTKQVLPKLPCNSTTYDNGTEFALHNLIKLLFISLTLVHHTSVAATRTAMDSYSNTSRKVHHLLPSPILTCSVRLIV